MMILFNLERREAKCKKSEDTANTAGSMSPKR